MSALRQKRPFTENSAGRSWSANGHASRSGLRDELSFTSFRHGGLTEGADSDLSDAELCADEFHPRASHSGAKGGRTKRWSFGRAAIAARSSSSSWVPNASRLAFWLSERAAFGITMTPFWSRSQATAI